MTIDNRPQLMPTRPFALACVVLFAALALSSAAAQAQPVPQCRDGIDNDGDTYVDFPLDPGCTDIDDDSELDTPDLSAVASDAGVARDLGSGFSPGDGGSSGSNGPGGDPGANQQMPPRDNGCDVGGLGARDGMFWLLTVLGGMTLFLLRRRDA